MPITILANHAAWTDDPVIFFRRIARRLGKPQAITATAHKLARIVFHLLNTKEAYNESVFMRCEEQAH
jgi:hypothetical protein